MYLQLYMSRAVCYTDLRVVTPLCFVGDTIVLCVTRTYDLRVVTPLCFVLHGPTCGDTVVLCVTRTYDLRVVTPLCFVLHGPTTYVW